MRLTFKSVSRLLLQSRLSSFGKAVKSREVNWLRAQLKHLSSDKEEVRLSDVSWLLLQFSDWRLVK